MPSRIQISNPARNIIVIVLFLFFVSLIIHSILRTKPVINKPFPGFLLLKNNLVPVVFLSEWEGFQRGIKFSDIILEVGGIKVTRSDEVRKIVEKAGKGTPLTYTILRRDKRFKLAIPVTTFTLKDFLIIHLIWMISGAAYYLLGLAVFFLRPNLRVSRVFLFLGLVSGMSMASNPGYCIDNSNDLSMFFLQLLGPSVLLLSLYFPKELKPKKYIIPLILATTILVIFFYNYYFYDISIFRIIDNIFLTHLVVTFGLGAFLMGYSFVTSDDPEVRMKGRVVVFGFIIAAVGGGLGLLGSMGLKVINFFWLFIPFWMVPLTVGYAIAKHNLFDVDVFIRRSVSYMAVSVIVIIVSFLLITSLSFILKIVIVQSSEIAAVITIFIMLVIFRPLRESINRGIERRFFGEIYEYQQTIRRAAGILNSIIELDELLNQILYTVIDAIKIERGVVLLKSEDQDVFKPVASRDYTEGFKAHVDRTDREINNGFSYLSFDHSLARHLENEGKPLQINDIEQMDKLGEDSETMLQVMAKLKIVLVIPIIYEYRLIGMLGLGPKLTGAWYSSEDIELLHTLMLQTAVSIDNAFKVAELKRMVELETSYRELKKIDEMKDSFLNMVSHDLRTPMTAIKAYTSIMRENIGKLNQQSQEKYLDIIIKQGDRLTRLINNLLDIQRFEAGKMEMDFELLDMREIAIESVDAFMALAQEKNIKLEKSIPSNRIIISGHRDRLSQVMSNLLSNAVKFTPENGRIMVSVKIITEDDKGAARVTVSDNGPGIPVDKQDRLFQKFHQVHEEERHKEQGTGLGLALVRQIVEYHNGRVGVTSEPGKGSNFYFLLPLEEQ